MKILDSTLEDMFTINGIIIDLPDFGTLVRTHPIDLELPEFIPRPSEDYVLEKYGITEEEYQEIAERLKDTWYLGVVGR